MNYDMKTLARDFWYGKPHQERRLGDLYIDKTGLYKHREWRGFKDTMYYFYNIWMYNYAHMVMDVVRYGGLINFAKGVWRYRWVGQTYLPVLHWFDRGMEGMRGEALKASAWHYRGMVNATIFQFQRMFSSDANLHGGKRNYRWHHNVAHNETVWGGVFYPWSDKFENIPMADVSGRGRPVRPRRHARLCADRCHLQRGLRRVRLHFHPAGLVPRQAAVRHAAADAV